VLETEVEHTVGVTDHQAKVVAPGELDPKYLPDQWLSSLFLEPEGGQVPDRLRDKVLVGEAGPQMQSDFDPAMRDGATPTGLKPSSNHFSKEDLRRRAPTPEQFAEFAAARKLG